MSLPATSAPRLRALAAAAILLAAPVAWAQQAEATPPDPPSATALYQDERGTLAPQAALARLNHYRRLLGLPLVSLDARLSMAARAHSRYLVHNHDKQPGLDAHNEYRENPGYTRLGEEAGNSVLAHGADSPGAIDALMNTLYHRLSLIGQGTGIAFGRVGEHSTVPNAGGPTVHGDTEWGWSGDHPPLYYPAEGQTDVPCSFSGEHPNPIPQEDSDGLVGSPITVSGDFSNALRLRKAVLQDEAGQNVPVWVLMPHGHAAQTVCLMAKDPLQAGTTYTVTVELVDGHATHARTWSFTTGE